MDDGKYSLIGGSCIVDPEGRILAESQTLEDEVIVADCDLDLCKQGKTRTFDFARHRRVEHYQRIVEQTGVIEPPKLGHRQEKPTNGTSPAHLAIHAAPSPPRKPIRILVANPNATPSMTAACMQMLQPTLPPDVEAVPFTAPHPAPLAVEGNADNALSGAAALRALLPLQARERYDAVLVACYSDHSLIRACREELDVPVVGIMEASLFAARTLGGRFGIVATSRRSKVMHEDAVRHYGMEGFCAGVEAVELGVLELERKARGEVVGRMEAAAGRLVERGAEVVTLGCAGMSDMKVAVERVVGEEVQVVDGVLAGVQHLVGLVRMGCKTAKGGLYTSSAEKRRLRGQDYV